MTLLLPLLAGCADPEPSTTDGLSVRILSPLNTEVTDTDLFLIGLIQGSSAPASLWWESTLSGVLDEDLTPDEDGIIYSTVSLAEGEHELWLYAEDGDEQAFDGINFTVKAASEAAPEESLSVSILSPADGSSYERDDTVTFQAEIADAGGDDLTVRWSSSLDGTLSIDEEPDKDGLLVGSTALSVGAHIITLSVEGDTDYGEDTISVAITDYNLPPEISIDLPSPGSDFEVDDQLYLKATVSDKEDLPEALEVTWSSDLDGVLTTEYAEKDGTARSNAALSKGSHTLTATVTDSGGKTAEDTTTVSVQ